MNVTLTKQELVLLNNALNESLELLDKVDYSTRLGATEDEIYNLLNKLNGLLEKLTGV